MAVFKLVRDGYKEYDALYKLVKYVLDADKMPSRCFGGNGINLYRPADSMYRIKNVFDKKFGNQAEHFIIAFDDYESRLLSAYHLNQIAYEICDYFKGVQILFALHEVNNKHEPYDYVNDRVHIHFVVNTVDLNTGNKFRIDFNNIGGIQEHILSVLRKYQAAERLLPIVG